MMKIGDICPLFFSPVKSEFDNDIDYVQRFYSTDKLLLQVFADNGEVATGTLNDLVNGFQIRLVFNEFNINGSIKMYYCTLTGLSDSIYSVTLNGDESETFAFCSDENILKETSLIRYSNKDNNSIFDNVFWIDKVQQVFEWRIEAGFKASGYAPKIDNEQYRNQRQEVEELYSVPYDSFVLSCGNSSGLPYWFGRHLNRVLCVSMVEINGKMFVRSESAVPELSPVMEGGQMFFISINLELQRNDIAGIGGAPELGNTPSIVGFDLENLKDGDMFKYSETKSAIVNTDKI